MRCGRATARVPPNVRAGAKSEKISPLGSKAHPFTSSAVVRLYSFHFSVLFSPSFAQRANKNSTAHPLAFSVYFVRDLLAAVREEKLKAKYEALKAEGGSRRVNKWIEKKRKKNAAKDRRRAPLESER